MLLGETVGKEHSVVQTVEHTLKDGAHSRAWWWELSPEANPSASLVSPWTTQNHCIFWLYDLVVFYCLHLRTWHVSTKTKGKKKKIEVGSRTNYIVKRLNSEWNCILYPWLFSISDLILHISSSENINIAHDLISQTCSLAVFSFYILTAQPS